MQRQLDLEGGFLIWKLRSNAHECGVGFRFECETGKDASGWWSWFSDQAMGLWLFDEEGQGR